ncbi:MAG: hypothetical protein ACOCV9_03675 [Marinilabiliaceae bacterium]
MKFLRRYNNWKDFLLGKGKTILIHIDLQPFPKNFQKGMREVWPRDQITLIFAAALRRGWGHDKGYGRREEGQEKAKKKGDKNFAGVKKAIIFAVAFEKPPPERAEIRKHKPLAQHRRDEFCECKIPVPGRKKIFDTIDAKRKAR